MRKNMGLYRGKPKHKEEVEYSRPDVIRSDGFIYGNLVVVDGKYFICTFAVCSHNTFVNNTRATMFEVIPETVGQFIGETDKNGRNVYEGDIVQFKDELFEIKFIEKYSRFSGVKPGVIFSSFLFSNSEVVANIYDNPELMPERGNLND